MKKGFVILLSLLSLFSCTKNLAPGESVTLNQGWKLWKEGIAYKIPAQVPGTVAASVETVRFEADSCFYAGPWMYETTFKADPSALYSLRFDGLGYRADIWLNGVQLASADTTFGVFSVHSFELGGLLRRSNTLRLRIFRAVDGDLNHGWVDWNPAPPDASAGILRDVTLKCHGSVSIEDVYVNPKLDDAFENASIELRVLLRNVSDTPVDLVLKGNLEEQGFEHPVHLEGGQCREEVFEALTVAQPRLWWTRDIGSPEMYSLSLSAEVDGAVSDMASRDFGIRSLTGRLNENGHRQYTLNGRDLLVLGAGWTDDVLLRDSHESISRQIELVKDAGLNCVRFENVWGKDSFVYDLCDREGLLVLVGWSCQWEWEEYCGIPNHPRYGCILDAEHNALAVRYLKDQLRWLRNHPSIAAFLTGSDRIPNPELEEQYFAVFDELSPQFSYVCAASEMASLAGPSGNKMTGPYEYVGPEYWVDARSAGGAKGFNTETSIGLNMPQMESLEKMIPGDARWPLGEAWNALCTVSKTAMHSTSAIEEAIAGQFGPFTSLEEFVSRAQALDYDGTRAMFEAFRIRRGEATGVVQWMLNSSCPSLYWQLYDWYGVPTAGYYGTKKACAPVQILFDRSNYRLYAVNSGLEPVEVHSVIHIYSAASSSLGDCELDLTVPAQGTAEAMDLSFYKGQEVFVFIGGDVDNFYALPATGNVHDWAASDWYVTPISSYADFRFLTALPAADLSLTREGDLVTVKNNSATVAFQVVLHGAPLASDNFFSLPPFGEKTVECGGAGDVWLSSGI